MHINKIPIPCVYGDMNKASAPPIYLTILREEKISVGDPEHFGADPAPDPTPFFIDFKDEFIFFLITCPAVPTGSSSSG
jgi:hypothetical protein